MPKNKTTRLIAAAIIIVLLLAGGYFVFASQQASRKPIPQNQAQSESGPENLSPEAIGLTLTASENKKQIKFSISKLSGIKAVAYQLTYEADSTKQEISEGGEPKVQRGIIGDAKFKSGDSRYESSWIDLGSASKNVVRYDTGINSVDLILKVTKDSGKVYQVEQKLDL